MQERQTRDARLPNSSSSAKRYTRVAVQASARISSIEAEIDPGSGERYFRDSFETCVNLSDGGLFVETGETLPPGRRVLVEIELPNQPRPVAAVGRVAWSRARLTPEGLAPDSGMGIEFVGSEAGGLARIASFIDAHEAERRRRKLAEAPLAAAPAPPPRGA